MAQEETMEGFSRKGSIYSHASGMFRIRERKGRAFEVEYSERPGLWISTGMKDFDGAVEAVRAMLHSGRRYSPDEPVLLRDFAKGFFTESGDGSYRQRQERFGYHRDDDFFQKKDGLLRNYILPRWGSTDIRRITTVDIEDWYVSITDYRHPGRQTSVGHKFTVLDALDDILACAVRKGVIQSNPCDSVQNIASSKESSTEIFTKEEILALFPKEREELMRIWSGSMKWALYFSIMADTGFRPCEVSGLSRSSFNGEGGVYTKEDVNARHGSIQKRIKTTDKGRKYKVGILSSYSIILLEEYLKTIDGEYLFMNEYGRFITPREANPVLQRACDRAGFDARDRTQYSFRHAFDTHMLDSLGPMVEESDVQELMGHMGYRGEYDHRTPDMIIRRLLKVRPAVEAVRKAD